MTSVKGDGKSDDAPSLNAILAQNAADRKVSYFPYGVYIVKSTLFVPPGTRIVGEAWSVISGKTDPPSSYDLFSKEKKESAAFLGTRTILLPSLWLVSLDRPA